MPLTVTLRLDDYLAQWFVHDSGGDLPVRLRRESVESLCLREFLQTRRRSEEDAPRPEGGTDVAVWIPEFRAKPAEYYNRLPRRGHDAIVSHIRGRFDYDMWRFLHTLEAASGLVSRQDLIYAFMEARGIEPDEKNYNAIAKRYQRMRDRYRVAAARREKRKK